MTTKHIINHVLERFENAVREHASRGGGHPEDIVYIEKEYEEAKQAAYRFSALPKKTLRLVFADDWCVLYLNEIKVYEGHESGGNLLSNLCEHIPYTLEYYKFTDENEIDGETPNIFSQIKGIKAL